MTDPIERITLTHLAIPFKEPFRISGGEVSVKDAILVTIETAGGIAHGESSPMAASFGYSQDTPEGCWNDLAERIAPTLLGKTFSTPADIAAAAAEWTGSRFAAAGAETALWDLVARARQFSIAAMLGASPDQVAMGVDSGLAVGLYPTVVELLKAIETHMAEGYKRVKIKIKPGHDLELVKAVRRHFGDDLELMVDANASYTVEHIDVFRQMDDFNLLMYEQPMAPNDLDGLAALQGAVVTPVCLDESADTIEQVELAIERKACRIVNLKIQRVGGLGPARAMHDLCAREGVACWVGTMPELGIGQAAGLHLATLGNCKYPSDIEPSARWFVADYTTPLLELDAPGRFGVTSRPGLGYEVDHAAIRHFQVRQESFTIRTTG